MNRFNLHIFQEGTEKYPNNCHGKGEMDEGMSVILKQKQFCPPAPQRTFGNILRHFGCHNWGSATGIHWVENAKHSTTYRMVLSQQRIISQNDNSVEIEKFWSRGNKTYCELRMFKAG